MTALLRKIALKKVEFIAFIVQTINLSCRGFVVLFFLYVSVCFVVVNYALHVVYRGPRVGNRRS